MKNGRLFFRILAPCFGLVLLLASAVSAQVTVNEFLPKGTEWVELYNAGASGVALDGWYVIDGDCGSPATTIGAGTTIGASGFFVVDAGDPGDNFDLDNSGDVVVLCDASHAEIDRVAFGSVGAAPLAPTGWSTARTSDGGDTDDDAVDWNLDETETKNASNDVPGTNLGSGVLINEHDNYPVAGNDMVELYNPSGSPADITGYLLSDGDAVAPLVGVTSVPAGGVVVLEETVNWTVSMDFSSADVSYLFDASGVRVDQLGWAGEYEDNCFARMPDGAGPNDGYDWTSSGGGTTLLDQNCTLGALNITVPVELQSFQVE